MCSIFSSIVDKINKWALMQHVVWKLTSNWSYQIKVQCLPPKCQVAENGNTLVKYKHLIIVPNCSTCVTFHLWLTRRHNVHLASSAVAPSPNWWRTSTLNSSTLFGNSNTLRRRRRGTHATPLRLAGWINICTSVATCVTTGQKKCCFPLW